MSGINGAGFGGPIKHHLPASARPDLDAARERFSEASDTYERLNSERWDRQDSWAMRALGGSVLGGAGIGALISGGSKEARLMGAVGGAVAGAVLGLPLMIAAASKGEQPTDELNEAIHAYGRAADDVEHAAWLYEEDGIEAINAITTDVLTVLDTDGDGAIQQSELPPRAAVAAPHAADLADSMRGRYGDRDEDGNLTGEEIATELSVRVRRDAAETYAYADHLSQRTDDSIPRFPYY